MKQKVLFSLTLALVMAMLFTVAVLADTVVLDGDIVTAGNQSSVNLGNVAPGATLNQEISFTLVCDSKQHVDSGQTVSLMASAQNVPAGGSLNATEASIGAIPSSWPDDLNSGGGSTNCGSIPPSPLTDNGNSMVTIIAPLSPGSYAYVVRYSFGLSPAGANDNNAIKSNHEDVTFYLTVDAPPSDTTPPEITPSIDGTLGLNNWYTNDVTVNWLVSDDQSAVSSTSGCDKSTVDYDTSGVTFTCTAISVGGTSYNSVTIKRDATAPTITASASPLPVNGWNNSDVTVSYTCIDNGPAGVDAVASDLRDDVLSASGTATGTCVDLAGNSDSASYSARIDKISPDFECTVPSDIWYGDNVTVNCTASDVGSGLTSNSDSSFALITDVGPDAETDAAQTGTKTLTDNAGNSVIVGPYTFKVDKKAPAVSCDAVDTNWHNANQSVVCTATDGGSGPASQSATLLTSVAADSETASAFTNSHEFNDGVGNKATAGPVGPFKIDMKAPAVTATPDRPADFGGWYNHALTITFVGIDGGSGVASCTSPVTFSGPDIATASVPGSCTDNVGNSASASYDFKYDATAPTMAPSVTPNPVNLNGAAVANANAGDALSGLASSSCDPVNTSSIGPHSVTCYAADVAGNTNSRSVSYTVKYNWSGFFQPVDNNVLNIAKAGQAIPLKWRLTDANGTPVTNLASVTVTVTVVSFSCSSGTTTDWIEEYAAGASGLQNLGDGYYQFNWKTPTSYASSCKTMKLNLGEGVGMEHTALFQFKK